MSKIEHSYVEIPFVFTSMNYVHILCPFLKDFIINIVHNLERQLVLIVSILGLRGFNFPSFTPNTCMPAPHLPSCQLPIYFRILMTINSLHYYHIFYL